MSGKKFLCVLICAFMAFAVSGCYRIPGKIWKNPNVENLIKQTEVYIGKTGIEKWHENNVISCVRWNKLKLSEEAADRYPHLSDALEEYNRMRLKEAEAQMIEFDAVAKELSGDDVNPTYCLLETRLYPQRTDNRILSFLEKIYMDYGAVHPEIFWKSWNFCPDTGDALALTDVLSDTKDLSVILEKKLREKYEGISFGDLKATFDAYMPEEFTWTLDYQGITFWFSPYEVASYKDGTPSVKIWFSEYPDMFSERYTKELPAFYAISIPVGLDIDFDLVQSDGEIDSVFFRTSFDMFNSYKMLTAVVNGNTYTDEINYGYNFDVYLVYMNGKSYFYYDLESDNDYHKICVLDINASEIKQIAELSGTGFYREYPEEDANDIVEYTEVFNDPFLLRLKTRFDILGTWLGYSNYYVSGEDGVPVMRDKDFSIESEYGIIPICPIDGVCLSDNQQITIPQGTVLYPIRTDGKTYMDVRNDEGTEIRLKIEVASWPRTVNGIPEGECFENLPYAG